MFTSERNGSADLFRVNPDGGGLKALTTDPAYDDQAAFSPDGQKLVFVSTREGGTANLWILDLISLSTQRLTTGPGGELSTFMVSRRKMDCVFVGTWETYAVQRRPVGTALFTN